LKYRNLFILHEVVANSTITSILNSVLNVNLSTKGQIVLGGHLTLIYI
jgi:hypothetical protein